jgi:hypothetical protein
LTGRLKASGDVRRCALRDASRVCAWCLADVGAESDAESFYVLAQVEDRAGMEQHDADFIEYPISGPGVSAPAYVRPPDTPLLEGAGLDFDLLFIVCGDGCSRSLAEALLRDRRILSTETWSKGL